MLKLEVLDAVLSCIHHDSGAQITLTLKYSLDGEEGTLEAELLPAQSADMVSADGRLHVVIPKERVKVLRGIRLLCSRNVKVLSVSTRDCPESDSASFPLDSEHGIGNRYMLTVAESAGCAEIVTLRNTLRGIVDVLNDLYRWQLNKDSE